LKRIGAKNKTKKNRRKHIKMQGMSKGGYEGKMISEKYGHKIRQILHFSFLRR
jgi:hypothetical protein